MGAGISDEALSVGTGRDEVLSVGMGSASIIGGYVRPWNLQTIYKACVLRGCIQLEPWHKCIMGETFPRLE
jgi:hypothetical protein